MYYWSIHFPYGCTVSYTFLGVCFLKEGRYEYKYIVDGKWVCNEHENITKPNADGHVNNYVQVEFFPESADDVLNQRP